MPNLSNEIPEIIISDASSSDTIYKYLKAGKVRKIASKLYTSNLTEAPEKIVRRHLWHILARLIPGALISDRTAFELKPTQEGFIYVISDRKRDIELPGLTIATRKGHPPLESDKPFMENLYLCSKARAFLENMRISRPRGNKKSPTFTKTQIEEAFDTMLRRSGEEAFLNLREEIAAIAKELDLTKEKKQLDDLMGTLLGTRDSKLDTPFAIARSMGAPYDKERLELFELLHRTLHASSFSIRNEKYTGDVLAFYESYFSNFIEGTEFAVKEAEEIIFEHKLPLSRPADAHDIIGTYHIVSNIQELKKSFQHVDDFLQILRKRHHMIMSERPEKSPGEFKIELNRAGNTLFVAPELINGTFLQAFPLYLSLEEPFQRAVFMMFLITEIHPFIDGNGRIARIMMNAELVKQGEQRIVIPTIYRNNYLTALKALSLNKHPDPLIRMLDFAQRYTHAIDWSSKGIAEKILVATHAFKDASEADYEGTRLKVPDETLIASLK